MLRKMNSREIAELIHESKEDLGHVWDSETYHQTREDFIEKSTNLGYEVVIPNKNELQIDLDTEEQFATFKSQLTVLIRGFSIQAMHTSISKGGLPGRHFVIVLDHDIDDIKRIALQAALGSDPLRELLSLMRHECGDLPTLLIETKGNPEDEPFTSSASEHSKDHP